MLEKLNVTEDDIYLALAILLTLSIYFLPTIVASIRRHSHTVAIFFLNLLAGASGFGWVAAFIWAFVDNSSAQKKTSVARDLKDLVQLKEDGILSEKEFERERKKLLGS